jgi:hypothetical protein
MQVLSDPAQIESPLIRDLFVYWRSRCRGGTIPRRADINPVELRSILPNLLMVDFEREPFRVKFRLVGTRIVETTGFEFTGRYLHEIAQPDVGDAFLECYETACRSRQPVFRRITWRFDEGGSADYDFCVLPLDDDGAAATKALAAECYERVEKQYDLSTARPRSASPPSPED